MEQAFEAVGRITPRNVSKGLADFLEMAGINKTADFVAGQVIAACAIVSITGILATLYLWPSFTPSLAQAIEAILPTVAGDASNVAAYTLFATVATAFFTVFTAMFAYAFILLAVDARKKQVESVLPDFLQLSAANVRAGMPVDQALWFAARPEFGLFAKEVELAARRTFGGEPFGQSLDKLAARFNSRYLKRSIALIKQGIASGGEMGEILERTGSDIRNMQILFKEVSASMLAYVIFILVASIIGAPFLFGVSYKLVNMLEKVFERAPPMENIPTALPITPTAPPIKSSEFLVFAFFACTLTAAMASLIIAVVQTGNKKNGAKIAPVFVLTTWIMLAIILLALDILFKGII